MRITSMLIRTQPQHMSQVGQALTAIPGVQLHLQDTTRGMLIITVEDGPGYAITDSITATTVIDQVLSATLIYEHTDEQPEPTEA